METKVDTHTHVGRHDDADAIGGIGDFGFLFVAEAGGADDDFLAVFEAIADVLHGRFGAREIDHYIEAVRVGDFRDCYIQHADTSEFTGIGSDQAGIRPFGRSAQLHAFGVGDGFNIGAPHAAAGPGYSNSFHFCFTRLLATATGWFNFGPGGDFACTSGYP